MFVDIILYMFNLIKVKEVKILFFNGFNIFLFILVCLVYW